MRIAMIGHKRIESCEGGIEKTVRDLSVYMAGKGHTVTVYNRGSKPEKEKFHDNIRIVNIPCPKGFAQVPVYSFLAAVHAAFGNHDVVMFHASGPSRMLPIVKITGKKAISFIHGLDSHSSKWGRFASWYLRGGEKTAAKRADELLVLSDHIKEYFEKTYGRSAVLVSNGIGPQELSGHMEGIPGKYGLRPGQFILWTGRISKEKGLQYLIPAFLNCHTDKKLVLAGEKDLRNGSFFQHLKKKYGDTDRIIYTGYISPDEVMALCKAAYVFALPSEQEGMPHSLLEALLCKAPCLLSDIPENRAVARQHALYFESRNAEDLRDKLQYMIDDPQFLVEMCEGEDAEVLERYDLSRSAQQILDICSQAAGREKC